MAEKKPAAKKAAQEIPSIQVRIDKLIEYEGSHVKAFASANIADAFAIHGIKVIDSQNGLFVSMPQNSYKNTNNEVKYNDIFHAVTAEARKEMIDKVLEAYEQALAEQQAAEETADEDQAISQSM